MHLLAKQPVPIRVVLLHGSPEHAHRPHSVHFHPEPLQLHHTNLYISHTHIPHLEFYSACQ